MASGHSLDAEDYSLYSSLGEEELIRMAVEQSLQEVCGGDGAPVQQLNAATATANPGLRRQPGSQGRRVVFFHGSQDQEGLYKPPTNKVSPWRSIPPPVQEQTGRPLDPVWEAVSADDGTALTRLRRSGAELRVTTPHGWMAVHEAAYHDKPCCLGILLQAHPDTVDARSKQNETPLYLAAYRGHVACVRILLAENATVDVCRHVKETPLYKACEINNSEVASLLITRRADVNYRNIYGNMPLHEATSKGNLELVKLLVAYGAKLQFKNKFGICPFFMAAQCGCLKVVRYLVSLGVDVNSEACDGTTVLFEAAKNGHTDVVEFLLSQGADPNRPTKDGLLPIHVVAANGNEEIVEQLMPVTDERQVRRSGISPLHLATKNGHSDVLELLLSSGGLDVNATLSMDRARLYEDCRSTPLYFAIINGDYRCAELLLEAGADPNIDLLNPLLVASRMHAYPLVRLLLNHGANVNAYIPARPTAFPATIMVCLRDLRILKLVLERGADGGACFDCPFGSGEHPPLPEKLKPWEERWFNGPGNVLQFCEMVASPEINSWAGPIIDTILHFVANVRLCSRLKEQLDTFKEWTLVKDIAECPRPLAHLCRLQIRASVGTQRVVLLEKLPLPRPLLNYLRYKDDDADSVAV